MPAPAVPGYSADVIEAAALHGRSKEKAGRLATPGSMWY